MKKIACFMGSLLLMSGFLFVYGCAKNEAAGDAAEDVKKSVVIYQNKVEINDALSAFAAEYSEETGVEVIVKTVGGDSPYGELLKAEFQSDRQPDIFVIEGQGGYNTWKNQIEPFVGQEWMNHTSLAFQADGSVYGFPVAIEGWGMAYNKAMLAKADIDPATLTSQAAYTEAFAKLDSMKDELEIDSVVAMTAAPDMTWVTGLHNFNGYLSAGLPYGEKSVLESLLSGQADGARIEEYADWVELLFQYSDKAVLLTGNYDAQVGQFATQKSVFIHQGNWIDPWLTENGVSFEMAYAPHASVGGDHNAIFIGAPSYYVMNKNSEAKQEVLDFLNYLATQEKGHDYMVNQAKMIPAFTNVTLTPSTPLSASVAEWNSRNAAYTWLQNDLPDGFGMGTLGPIYGAFASGDIDKLGFIEQVTAKIAELK
ncbi:extracellular solute-binding protein [Candidatus Haliotispira prima]|uniref:Extracellular solute-binding protein n=1 Tax=Candidatus Haliotispira prima TaxID=3034016 RepID=A0ABY8MG36_9SPIO|nr:extracellular solute-binding protein [Candidatus Haliotispira prima]